MAQKFITSCFIEVTDSGIKKYVINLCKLMGYREITSKDVPINARYILCHLDWFTCSINPNIPPNVVNCGTNVLLFLALAGMREDTANYQWFVYKNEMYNFSDCDLTVKERICAGDCRYATAEEIVEHFKSK